MVEKEKFSGSFQGFDIRVDNKTGKLNYVTTGSIVGEVNGKTIVYEQQIDINLHPPINQPHFQECIRAADIGKRPKKVKSEIISELNHRPIEFLKY